MDYPPAINFTSLTFDTVTSDPACVCLVAVTRVESGLVAYSDSWVVTPPTAVKKVKFPSAIRHGVIERKLRRKGIDWVTSLARIDELRASTPVVWPNAFADQRIFTEACLAAGVSVPDIPWLDAFAILRSRLGESKGGLIDVAREPKVKGKVWVNKTLARSVNCAHSVIEIARRDGLVDASELENPSKVESVPWKWPRDNIELADLFQPPEVMTRADSSHPLYGKNVALAGGIRNIGHWRAFEKIGEVGGIPQGVVNFNTDVLVIDEDAESVGNSRHSGGIGEASGLAEYLRRKGHLTIMSENDLLQTFEWTPESMQVSPGFQEFRVRSTSGAKNGQHSGPSSTVQSPSTGPEKGADPIADYWAPERDETRTTGKAFPAPLGEAQPIEAHARTQRPGDQETRAAHPRAGQQSLELEWNQCLPHDERVAIGPGKPAATCSRESGPESAGRGSDSSRGSSAVRKIIGWAVLIPSVLATLFMLAALVLVLVTPGDAIGIRLTAAFIILIIGLVPGGFVFLGVYLIWLRDRWRTCER